MRKMDFDKDYLTITEFSKFTGISEHMLRHYDREGILPPARRGANGYRLYSPIQITSVNMIPVLGDIGLKNNQIAEMARHRTPKKALRHMRRQSDKVTARVNALAEERSIIETHTDLLNEALCISSESDIDVYNIPEQRIIMGDANDYTGTSGFVREFLRFCRAPHTAKLNQSYPIGGYFDSMAAFTGEPSQPTRFYSLCPRGLERREAGLYMVAYTRGYYGQTNDLPERMTAYAKEKIPLCKQVMPTTSGAYFSIFSLKSTTAALRSTMLKSNISISA